MKKILFPIRKVDFITTLLYSFNDAKGEVLIMN